MATEEPRNAITRRRMLKRMGAGAAVAWTAPVILSVRTPAFAAYNGTCADAVLSGGADPLEPVCVDDDITVYVNGTPVFVDDNVHADCWPPISVGLVNNGDQLRVTAIDSFGVCHGLSPLYLHCPSTGASQTLDPVGVPGVCDGAPPQDEPFYDQTFTVNL